MRKYNIFTVKISLVKSALSVILKVSLCPFSSIAPENIFINLPQKTS